MVGVLVCVSVSHRTADFALLERLSAAAAADPTAGLSNVRGSVVVATCNRYESYLDVDDVPVTGGEPPALTALLAHLAERAGVSADRLHHAARTMTGSRVAAHLFAVASGLDSVVVGEDEIAGQVRRALTEARDAGTTTPSLERAFQMAATTSRDVKNVTRINAAGRSMVRLALDLAESRVPAWDRANVLLIGTGAYAGTTWAALRERGATEIGVASPSGREQVFAQRDGVHAVSASARGAALAQADLVITSTRVQTLDVADISRARAHTDSPLLVIDLGLPSNVDKAVADLPGVELLDLETISLHAPVQELDASARAMDMVRDAAASFEVRSAEQSAGPAIAAYRGHVDQVLAAELNRLAGRGKLTEETERALRHFAGVLVHEPTTRARRLAAEGRLTEVKSALGTLYGLDPVREPEEPQRSTTDRGTGSG
ncbi:glutamyl-tRNA reductase [Ruania zhangjianzhongii]|uniref:glutamyl-tRNA reductase n=1 Tax=Ruania zhangjianzhongii TaxID=2603206 RepID=UPI0022A81F46|nr:glutamyl-tRNA reductase [Ruania zhangjianzhongii]